MKIIEVEVQNQESQKKSKNMANKFRPIENIPETENKHSEIKERKNSRRKTNEKKSVKVSGKKFRKILDNIFGLGILRKINFRKNLPYFIMVIIMIIWLINNSLKIQSKRSEIEKLKDDITKVNDMLMDIIEEEYNIDDKREKELLQIAKEEGFQSGGYIPYTIKIDKK